MSPGRRTDRGARFALLVLVVAGCSALRPATTPLEPPLERLELDAKASPISFRRLGDHAVLVGSQVGQRQLASFGNFVGRSAKRLARTRLAVWDDETAWKRSQAPADATPDSLRHKRAEYLKETGSSPVEQFTVFERDGRVSYERDFRDWPLTGTDSE